MKYLRKHLLISLLVSISGSVLAYTTYGDSNFDWNHLPANMEAAKKATVGIKIVWSSTIKQTCTGVRISPDKILTAAHCLYNANNTLINPNNSDQYIDIYENNGKTGTALEVKKIQLGPQLLADSKYQVAPAPKYISSLSYINNPSKASFDAIVIKVITPTKLTKSAPLLNTDIIVKLDDLNKVLFDPKTKLYGFGWGSHYQEGLGDSGIKLAYHFAMTTTNTTKDSNNNLGTPDTWSYLYSKDSEGIPKASRIDTLNPSNQFFDYDATSVNKYITSNGDTVFPGWFLNSNVFLISNKTRVSTLIAEPGDSGGPLFSVDTNNKVKLIGMSTRASSDFKETDKRVAYTTIANPIVISTMGINTGFTQGATVKFW